MGRLFKPRKTIQRNVAEAVAGHMGQIKALFPGAKLTLVVRSDALDKPLIFTNDKPEETIAAIREMTRKENLVVTD